MKPLVTTSRTLRELATNLSPRSLGTSPVLFEHSTDTADYLLSVGESGEGQRVFVMRDDGQADPVIPNLLEAFRREVLSRMSSFADRARMRPITLPRGWNQYKHDNLVAFWAVPGSSKTSSRWIAELLPGERGDVAFWKLTTSGSKSDLADFDLLPRHVPDIAAEWADVVVAAERAFEEETRPAVEVDMELPATAHESGLTRSYDEWLTTISDDQRRFVLAPAEKSIRLRGPAGSGKTLALTLKAVREALSARTTEKQPRILIVTHSWSLAAQIQQSIDSLGMGRFPEIDVFPLLEFAREFMPSQLRGPSNFTMIGDDSHSGKMLQLDQILEVLDEFISGDWISYRARTTPVFRNRFDSDSEDDRLALAWDLLIEFGSVIGPAAIFPGAGADARYFQLVRAHWMLPLSERGDLEVVYKLYTNFMRNLEDRALVTSDQVLADFLNYLETHAWNRSRKTDGYDLIFIDEFHLFSPLERHVLGYLTRDVYTYPRMFMAVDPRQSPSEAFIGLAADETRSLTPGSGELGDVDADNFELTTIHRFSPQILDLVKHVHLSFPQHELGSAWDIDYSRVESSQVNGDVPALVISGTRQGEDFEIVRAIQEMYQSGRVALAVVDSRQWQRLSALAAQLSQSGRFHVSTLTGRTDVEGLGYRKKGVVLGSAEHLAGLQFEAVVVAGMPDLNSGSLPANERTRLLSLLYLALSRAEREVRVFVNEEDGGAPEVLSTAADQGIVRATRGTL